MSTYRPRYNHRHRQARAHWDRIVASGRARCARCSEPIQPTDAWHLDHTDDGSTYLGASHASCNIGAGNTARTRGTSTPWSDCTNCPWMPTRLDPHGNPCQHPQSLSANRDHPSLTRW